MDDAMQSVRRNEKWRLDYMTLQQEYREKYNEGLERGIEQGKIKEKIRNHSRITCHASTSRSKLQAALAGLVDGRQTASIPVCFC